MFPPFEGRLGDFIASHRIALLRPVKTNQQCLCSNFSDSEAPSVFHTEIKDCIVLPLAHRQTDRQTNRQTRGADPSRNQGRRNERRDKQTTDKPTNKDKRAVCRGADRSGGERPKRLAAMRGRCAGIGWERLNTTVTENFVVSVERSDARMTMTTLCPTREHSHKPPSKQFTHYVR